MSGKNVATERHEPQLGLGAIAFGARESVPGVAGRAETLECLPSAAGRARRLVTDVLRAWSLDELCGDAKQIVTELVANVVTHTTCPSFRLEVRRGADGGVRIEVSDGSSTAPVPRRPGDGSECGRGLLLIEALSSRWGCDRRREGKTVWAELGNARGEPVRRVTRGARRFERVLALAGRIEARWARHVTQRDLHRKLDGLRVAFACAPEVSCAGRTCSRAGRSVVSRSSPRP